MKAYRNFKHFIAEATRGEVFVYHTGNLAADRQTNDLLSKTASDVLEQYQRGFVEVWQKKLSKNKFEYRAVRVTDIGRRLFTGSYRGV